MERYDRQIRLKQVGQKGQEKLAASTVLIVGCGALGTYAAEQLTRAGVGRLILVDYDRVEASNLQRQTLFTEADIGRLKVEAAAEHLAAINSTVHFDEITESFGSAIFQDFAPPDLLLDCTDNFLVRHTINDYCLHHRIPFVFSGAAGVTGQVMAVNPAFGPCLNCVFPNLTDLEAAGCETLGVLTSLIPLISGLQLSLALRLLMEADFDDWTTLHYVSSWPIRFDSFQIHKNAACPVCGNTVKVEKLRKTCGDAFQGFLVGADLHKIAGSVRENPFASLVKYDEKQITAFKNGRLLFYGFDSIDDAQEAFQILASESSPIRKHATDRDRAVSADQNHQSSPIHPALAHQPQKEHP